MFNSYWAFLFLASTTNFHSPSTIFSPPLWNFITLDSQHRFTRNTVTHLDLPLLDPLPPPTRRSRSHTETALDSSGIPRPIPRPLRPSRPPTSKMPKIDLPLLTGELDAANITSWLNLCTDSFEVWSAMNSDKEMKASLQIVLAGLKMDSPPAKHWWNENRDELKALPNWDAFAQRVKDRFVPANWRMDALAKFYKISQGSSPFLDFVTTLQNARNALASSGSGFTVNDSILKNHLLFFCHPVLSLRIRSIPNFKYGEMKLDALIGLMNSTWESMIAENIVRPALSSHSLHTPLAQRPFLSDSEREKLKLAGGCFRCRRTPASPGWTQHGSRDCPGDKSKGIPPAPPRNHIAAVLHEDDSTIASNSPDSDANVNHISAVLPSSFVLHGDEWDEDFDSDNSNY